MNGRKPFLSTHALGIALLGALVVGGCAKGADPGTNTQCGASQTACGTACFDTLTSAQHCGSCDKACATGQQCVAGQCACGGQRRLRLRAAVVADADALQAAR